MIRQWFAKLRRALARLALGRELYEEIQHREAMMSILRESALVYAHDRPRGLRLFVAATYGEKDPLILALRQHALGELSKTLEVVGTDPAMMN